MVFSFSTVNLINALFIAAGIGICGLCFLQITSSGHLRKEVRRYFQVFFLLILLYISTHLARQLMDGLPGAGVRTALQIVTLDWGMTGVSSVNQDNLDNTYKYCGFDITGST